MSVQRRSTRLIVASLLLVAAYIVSPALWVESSENERVRAWLASHAGDLPSTIEELTLFPASYRQAIYGAASVQSKAALWRSYLLRTAELDPSLTTKQRTFLRRFAEALKPADFEPNGQPEPRTLALLAETEAALGRHADIIRRDFWSRAAAARSGKRVSLWTAVAAARVHVTEYLVGHAIGFAQTEPPRCECYVQAEGIYDCPGVEKWRKFCRPDVDRQVCTYYDRGCDIADTHPCDGLCGYYTGGDDGGGGGSCDGCFDGGYCSAEYVCCSDCV